MSRDTMNKAAPWVAISLTVVAMIVAATVWFPSMAQERVDSHAKAVDEKQDKKIEALQQKVNALLTAQAVSNERMKAQNEKLDKIILQLER